MAAKGKRSVEQLEAEIEYLRLGGIAEHVARTVRVLLVCLCLGFIVYIIAHALESFAGKVTEANILVDLFAKLDVSVVLSWVVGAAGAAYGYGQRQLRKRTVERLQGRILDLEKGIDPKRTSSKLTPRGDTNPEDA